MAQFPIAMHHFGLGIWSQSISIAGAIFLAMVPATIMTSDWRGEGLKTPAPKRSRSKREAPAAIISIAQHARPNVIGHSELARARLKISSRRANCEFARSEGFSYFEGYFFRKPEMMRARGAQSYRTVYLRLLGAISRDALDWKELEDIIKSDPMLYYRLLRYLNSALFGMRGEVKNISQALTILGEDQIRRWCRLSGMLELSRNKPSDLALASLVRAKFAESIATRVDCGDSDLFQVGLLSLMDAILEIHMRDVLQGLPLEDDAKKVLLENEGPLAPVYDLMLAMEAGVWPKIESLAISLHIEQDFIAKSYWDAMEWAQSVVTIA